MVGRTSANVISSRDEQEDPGRRIRRDRPLQTIRDLGAAQGLPFEEGAIFPDRDDPAPGVSSISGRRQRPDLDVLRGESPPFAEGEEAVSVVEHRHRPRHRPLALGPEEALEVLPDVAEVSPGRRPCAGRRPRPDR